MIITWVLNNITFYECFNAAQSISLESHDSLSTVMVTRQYDCILTRNRNAQTR